MTTSVQRHGRVLRSVISAAERGSTLDREAMQQALAAMLDPGPDTGAILLAGAEADFCTGGDVGIAASAASAEGREGVRAFRERHPPGSTTSRCRANGGGVE